MKAVGLLFNFPVSFEASQGVTLTLFDMGFLNRQSWRGGMRAPHHNFVVIALMIRKFGTGIKLDVFYTIVTKNLGSHYYYVIMTS